MEKKLFFCCVCVYRRLGFEKSKGLRMESKR